MTKTTKNYTTVNIQTGLIHRVDNIFKTAGYNTRAGLINDILRRAIEQIENKKSTLTQLPEQQKEREMGEKEVVRKNNIGGEEKK